MNELWTKFIEWYNNAGVGNILQWVLTVAIPTTMGIIYKASNNAKIKEVIALEKSKQSQNSLISFTETVGDKMTNLKGYIDKTQSDIDKLSALVLLVLKSANISAEDKDYALKIYNTAQTKIEKVETTKETVQNTLDIVKESVKVQKEKETNADNALKDSLNNLAKEVSNE